jgi:hypothetical protein
VRPQKRFVPQDQTFAFKGLDDTSPSTSLLPSLSPSLENVEIKDGTIQRRWGYTQLGDTMSGQKVLCLVNFEALDGTRTLVAITDVDVMFLDTSDFTWDEIVEDGAYDWTASEDYPVSFVVATGTIGGTYARYLIFTNGNPSAPKMGYWDGNTGGSIKDFAALVTADIASFTGCSTLDLFYDSLILGNIFDSGSGAPTKVMWSDTSVWDEWTTGNSGEASLSDIEGSIQSLRKLGDRLVVYGGNSIGILAYVGGEIIFSYQHLIDGTALASPLGIIDAGPFHLLLSREDVYFFYGAPTIHSVGKRVSDHLINSMDSSELNFVNSFTDSVHQRAIFITPTSDTESKLAVGVFDFDNARDIKWTLWEFNDRPLCFSTYVEDSSLRWNSGIIVGRTWTSFGATPWRSETFRAKFPNLVFGTSEGKVFSLASAYLDNSVDKEAWWQSGDFVVADAYKTLDARFLEIEFELTGTEVKFSYSVDQGASWSTEETRTLTSDWNRQKFFFDKIGRSIRVRLRSSGTANSFSLRWLRLWLIPGSER